MSVTETNKSADIDLTKCISDSFDGAANMSGEYNGVTSWLKRYLLGHIHVWCNAHVLNLVMTETTECCIPAINLFGLLNEIGVFFRDSYLRLDVWKDIPEGEKGMTSLKKLSTIGATRWWSKDKVLRTVFGEHDDFDKSLYVQAIMALYRHDIQIIKIPIQTPA